MQAKRVDFEVNVLKEIEILMGFIARKSDKIGEIESMLRKRHLSVILL